MISQEIIVTCRQGFHARPSAMIVQKAVTFQSDITIEKNAEVVSAKKITLGGIMQLGITRGDKIKISAQGRDEEEALSAIMRLIENMG
ncbi:MAG: HPr family phosphocarrier protein [Candidatus Omnitrophota bacterium]